MRRFFSMKFKHIAIFTFSLFALSAGLTLPVSARAARRAAAAADGAQADELYVAAVGEMRYTRFEDALAAWTDPEEPLVLLADVQTSPIEVDGTKTLDLGDSTLSLSEGETGSVLSVKGELTVTGGGKITGGNAHNGGGVLIEPQGILRLEGGEISGNTAESTGGGVCVLGKLYLGGEASVKDNHTSDGADSNVFLTNGNKISVSAFTGEAGITLAASPREGDGVFAEGDGSGRFFSDDLSYTAEGYALSLAKLCSVTAVYTPAETVYPTTELSTLKEYVLVEGVNVNGAPYIGEIEVSLSGNLRANESSEIFVKATGESGETAETSIFVPVQKPSVRTLSASLPEEGQTVYFDTPLSEIRFTLKGQYDDGVSRTICDTPAKTAYQSGEEYITDSYTLSGDLNVRENGMATVTVSVGTLTTQLFVPVSRRVLNAADFAVRDVSAVAGRDALIPPERFVADLPDGIEPVPTLGGKPLSVSSLEAGEYEVEISFAVRDTENYEVVGVCKAKLTVLRAAYTGSCGSGPYRVERAEGIPPAWEFHVKEIEGVKVKIEGSYDVEQAFELTLQEEGIVVEDAGTLTVRLPLAEELRGKRVTLFRVQDDGTAVAVEANAEEDSLVFSASEFSHTRYVVAVEGNFGLYLGLAVGFGLACVCGAIALLAYIVFKRRLLR